MLERCYSTVAETIYKNVYRGCSELFLCFSHFVDWCIGQDNYNDLFTFAGLFKEYVSVVLESDILNKEKFKFYSENNCCLVPKEINNLLKTNKKCRGNLPVGLQYIHRQTGVLARVERDILDKKPLCKAFTFTAYTEDVEYYRSVALQFYEYYGIEYKDEELAAVGAAWLFYKKEREEYIKEVATSYRFCECGGRIWNLISKECYNALMSFKVKITDKGYSCRV